MRHTRIWIVLITLVLLVGLLLPIPGSYALSKEARKRAQLATVKIYILDANGDEYGGCSGTMLDTVGYILTNFHCVGAIDEESAAEAGIEVGETYHPQGLVVIGPTKDPKQTPVPTYIAQTLSGDPTLDIAVLKIIQMYDEAEGLPPAIPVVPITLGDSDIVEDGDPIFIMGYPGVGGSKLTTTEGKIAGVDDADGDGMDDAFKHDANQSSGNSGGLATNDAGEQIGIPTFSIIDGANKLSRVKMINIAVPSIEEAQAIGGSQVGAPEALPSLPTNSTTPNATTPPAPSDGPFGAPIFGTELQEDGLAAASTQIDSGAATVYCVFQYNGLRKNADWGYVFSYKGKEVTGDSTGERWELSGSGTTYVSLSASTNKALPDGPYQLTLYVAGKPVSEGSFTIGAEQQSPPQPRPPAQQPIKGVQIQGQIVDADTKRPISGASFVLLKPGVSFETWSENEFPDDQVAAEGITDQKGLYLTVPALERGQTYILAVGAKGYRLVTGDYPIEESDPALFEQAPIELQKK